MFASNAQALISGHSLKCAVLSCAYSDAWRWNFSTVYHLNARPVIDTCAGHPVLVIGRTCIARTRPGLCLKNQSPPHRPVSFSSQGSGNSMIVQPPLQIGRSFPDTPFFSTERSPDTHAVNYIPRWLHATSTKHNSTIPVPAGTE